MTTSYNRRQLGWIAAAVVLVGAGGWVAGSRLESPADAAAHVSVPAAGPVTVAVQQRRLTATVVGQGTVQFGSPEALSLAGAVGPGTADVSASGQAPEQRVTRAPAAGTVLKQGAVLMEVSGRPVMVLAGSVPMYRTIGPGTSGADVRQLQLDLRQLGFYSGTVSGVYGDATAAAVSNWYNSRGYQAQGPSSAERQQLGQLQEAVTNAQVALLSAEGAGGSGSTGAARSSPSGSATTGASSSPSSPAGSTRLAKLQKQAAQQSLDAANAALSAFTSSYGTTVPVGELVFLPSLPMRLDKVSVKVGDAPSGPIGTATTSDLVVQAVVDGSDAQVLHKGMAVRITTTDGKNANGTVSTIGSGSTGSSSSTAPVGGGAGSGQPSSGQGYAPVPVNISVSDPSALAGEASSSVTVTFQVGASNGSVLAVPVAAVRTSADGQARVQVQHGSSAVTVPVSVGISSGGLVQVTPTSGSLEVGDHVVVGQ